MDRLKMKHKVILAFVALTTVAVAMLSYLSLTAFRSSVAAEVFETNRFFARYLASSLEGKMTRACRVAETLASSPGLTALQPEQVRLVLNQCLDWSGHIFSDIWYFSPDGRLSVTVPERQPMTGKHFSQVPGMGGPLAQMRRTGKTVVVGRFLEAKKGQKALIVAPAGNSGAFLSALVDFGDWKTFSRAGARSGYAALVDVQGAIVSLDPDPRGLRGSSFSIAVEGVARPPHALKAGQPGVRASGDDTSVLTAVGSTSATGGEELITVTAVQLLDFRLIVSIPVAEAFRGVEKLRTRIWMLTALFWVGAALLGAAFAARITRPLTILKRHVEQLERGQTPEELEWCYDDEIGVLGRAINAMARTLKRERVMKDVFGFKGERE